MFEDIVAKIERKPLLARYGEINPANPLAGAASRVGGRMPLQPANAANPLQASTPAQDLDRKPLTQRSSAASDQGPGFVRELGKGAASAWLGANKAVNSILEYAGELSGSDTLQNVGKTGSEYWGRKMEPYAARKQNFTDLDWSKPRDVLDWAAWNIGQMGGQVLMTLPFMAAGRAKDVIGAGQAMKGLFNEGGVKQAGKFLAQWAKPRKMDIPIGMLEAGEIAEGQLGRLHKGEVDELDPIRGLAAAFVATKLEELGAENMVSRLFAKGTTGVKGQLFKKIGQEALATGFGEGVTEFFQTYAEQAGIDPSRAGTMESFMEAVNAAAAGMVGGAAMGAGGGAYSHRSENRAIEKIKGIKPDSVPTGQLPDIQRRVMELSEVRPGDKDLADLRDSYAAEIEKRKGNTSDAREELLKDEDQGVRSNMTAKDVLNAPAENTGGLPAEIPGVETQADTGIDIQSEEDLTPDVMAKLDKTITGEPAITPRGELEPDTTPRSFEPNQEPGPEPPESASLGVPYPEEPPPGPQGPGPVAGTTDRRPVETQYAPEDNVFARMPDDVLKQQADYGVQGAKDELARREINAIAANRTENEALWDVTQSDSFKALPDYAQRAIFETHMERQTNQSIHSGLLNAEWETATVPVEDLKKGNEIHWSPEKQTEYATRKIYNEGPAIVDFNGKLIDGNHKYNRALRNGDKTIEVYRPVASPEVGAPRDGSSTVDIQQIIQAHTETKEAVGPTVGSVVSWTTGRGNSLSGTITKLDGGRVTVKTDAGKIYSLNPAKAKGFSVSQKEQDVPINAAKKTQVNKEKSTAPDKRQVAIAKYIEHAKTFTTEEGAKAQAAKWIKAIEEKDYKTLRGIMNGINPKVNHLFTALTGLPAKTQKEADASLRSFDPEGWDKWQTEKTEEREKESAERVAAHKKRQVDELLSARVRYRGEEMTRRDLLQRLVNEEGYDSVEEQKRGATTNYNLVNNAEGKVVSIPKKILVEHVRGLIDQKKPVHKTKLPEASKEDLDHLFGKDMKKQNIPESDNKKEKAHTWTFKKEHEADNTAQIESLSYVGKQISREELPNGWVKVTYENKESEKAPVMGNEAPAEGLPPNISQRDLAIVRERIKRAKELGASAKGYEDWLKVIETGDKEAIAKGPTVKDTIKAINQTIAKREKALKEEEAQKQESEKAEPIDLTKKSTAELVSDIFSIINDHIGQRGSISTEEKTGIDKSLYQKIKPYLKVIADRATAKALDVKAYLFGAVDSMPEGQAKAIYEAAANLYIEEDSLSAKENKGKIKDKEEIPGKEGENATTIGIGEQGEGPAENDQGSLAGEGAENVSGTEESREAQSISGGEERPDHGSIRPSVAGRNEPARGKGIPEEGTATNGNREEGVGGNAGNVPGVQRSRNHRIETGSIKRQGSWRTTAETNLDIIELVKKLEAEGRQATPEEQSLLAKYTGWGASELANNMFPGYAERGEITPSWLYGDKKQQWGPLVERLINLLTPEEIRTAARSTQYAHYTSEAVIRSIYKALARFGFNGGKILEPGMGVGSFAGLIPENMVKGSSYTGIEMDGITATIAKYLYPGFNVIHGDYTKQAFPNNFFDLGIGNPPFS